MGFEAVYAQNGIEGMLNASAGEAGYATNEATGETGLATVIGGIVRVVLSLLGIVFIVYTIYGGIVWMTAAGNEDKVGQAKKTIRDGVIGIIIVLGSLSIYLFVYSALIGTATGV
jgi:hypothetical protein